NVILSGGGARTFAQIGALRAFKEFGIPVDRIAGCSGGSAIGAMRALTEDFEGLALKLRDLFLRKRPAREFTLPVLSLLAGKKMTSIVFELFEGLHIEDLPTRYFCNSSDLGTGEIVEHFDGLVWHALRASGALPVTGPPLLKDNRLLVDGGVLNNLPVDIMRRHFTGRILAIDVSRHRPLKVHQHWDLRCPSGFEVLFSKLNPFGPKAELPGIIEILLRTTTLASDRLAQQNREQADFLLVPPVQKFGVTEFEAYEEIVEAGYRHTVSVLEKREAIADGTR
ncbi:MAG TPA: patatin-like phospholipase family protein, partial [Bryobacteraceae bacterium]|nr:patatin-like phospholipase family protein [Bryobacteraceae bacterium]